MKVGLIVANILLMLFKLLFLTPNINHCLLLYNFIPTVFHLEIHVDNVLMLNKFVSIIGSEVDLCHCGYNAYVMLRCLLWEPYCGVIFSQGFVIENCKAAKLENAVSCIQNCWLS